VPKIDVTVQAEEASSSWRVEGYSDQYLTLATLPGRSRPPPDSPGNDLLIADLDSCILNLVDKANEVHIQALHVRNVRKCVLLLPPVKGSALVHDLTSCVIVLGCHQVDSFHQLLFANYCLSASAVPHAYVECCRCLCLDLIQSHYRTL
jgi:hypothetical protein